MKTEITITNTRRSQCLGFMNESASNITNRVCRMTMAFNNHRTNLLKYVARIYSSILEEEISVRKAARILNAQMAFLALLLCATTPLMVTLPCLGWLISALMRCRG